MSRKPSPQAQQRQGPTESLAPVVALNDEAAAYLALASEIRGTAVDLSPAGRNLLRQGLAARFGPLLSSYGPDALDELVRLATEPTAA